MEQEILNLTYASSLTDLCEVNSSFDSAILRIAYSGTNRNKSSISKEVFERCAKTIFNCPVVCNYDRESDSIGDHDMDIVADSEGNLRLVNLTQPVGVVPGNAKVFWETVEEDDGTLHEYLCTEVLLWKRQEAFRKIKKDGITSQSMEIKVKDGKSVNGIYMIYDFEFTAFALLGVEPCYESASLVFSKQQFKQQFSEMMLELKECFSLIETPNKDNDTYQENSMEGGEKALDKNELISKYGIDVQTLDFSIDDFTAEELELKFKAMTNSADNTDPEPNAEPDGDATDKFALTEAIVSEIERSLSVEKISHEWGDYDRYCYVDCDFEAHEVYCWDSTDWLLYAFTYEANGDNIVIDFATRKRMKYVIEAFDEGEQESPFSQVFSNMANKICECSEFEAKYHAANDAIASMEEELSDLRKYKADAEEAIEDGKRNDVFSKFEDLVGVEAFDNLKDTCKQFSVDELEEKCFAIRGRHGANLKFSMEQKAPKLPVEKPVSAKEDPYNGIFEQFGISNN